MKLIQTWTVNLNFEDDTIHDQIFDETDADGDGELYVFSATPLLHGRNLAFTG